VEDGRIDEGLESGQFDGGQAHRSVIEGHGNDGVDGVAPGECATVPSTAAWRNGKMIVFLFSMACGMNLESTLRARQVTGFRIAPAARACPE
jgi:hypothetical protein